MLGFHLAGGEAFLNFPLLLKAVELANEFGIPLDYVETNCGWFTDEKSAIDKLTQLRNAGLSCLLISASPFHSEYIPIEKTLGVVRASMTVFGHSGTMIWLQEFLQELTSIASKGIISLERYIKKAGEYKAKRAAVYGGQLIPGGRSGLKLAHLLPQCPKEAYFDGNCFWELTRSGRGHFDLHGNIIPGVCSGISVGNAHDLELAYRGFNYEDHPIIAMLCKSGVKGLCEMAMSDYGFVPRETYAGKCDLCVDIRKHLFSCNDAIPELGPTEFYENLS